MTSSLTSQDRSAFIECPYPGANLKAKVLGDLLERHLGADRPYVRAAVFLPSQRLVMPEAWLANAHRAAEMP